MVEECFAGLGDADSLYYGPVSLSINTWAKINLFLTAQKYPGYNLSSGYIS
jgi:hypothetical protein